MLSDLTVASMAMQVDFMKRVRAAARICSHELFFWPDVRNDHDDAFRHQRLEDHAAVVVSESDGGVAWRDVARCGTVRCSTVYAHPPHLIAHSAMMLTLPPTRGVGSAPTLMRFNGRSA